MGAQQNFLPKKWVRTRWIYPCGEATLCTFLLKLRVISWEDGQSQACTSHLCAYQPTNFLMHNRDTVKKKIAKMLELECGIIEPTSSEKEICVEYCQLNGASASDAYLMPRVNDKCGRHHFGFDQRILADAHHEMRPRQDGLCDVIKFFTNSRSCHLAGLSQIIFPTVSVIMTLRGGGV